jgi:hypothetical protein
MREEPTILFRCCLTAQFEKILASNVFIYRSGEVSDLPIFGGPTSHWFGNVPELSPT